MKKKLISFALSMVMLFSCLSLNVLAAGTDAVEEKNVTGEHTHTVEEIVEALKIKDTRAALPGEAGFFVQSSGDGSLTYSDGKYVKTSVGGDAYVSSLGPTKDGENRAHTTLNLYTAFNSENFKASAASAGQPFVFQATFSFTDAWKTDMDSVNLFRIADYVANVGKDGNPYVPYSSSSTGINGVLLKISSDLKLSTVKGTTKEIATLKAGEEYTISVFVNPKENVGDFYGSYSVYLNGNCIAERIGLFSETANGNLTFEETVPYVTYNSWSDIAGKVVKADAEVCFFSENVPENWQAIVTDAGITVENGGSVSDLTAVALGRTKNGVQDLTLGLIRPADFNNDANENGSEVATMTNPVLYYTNDFSGDALDHRQGLTHTHDVEESVNHVSYTCKVCGASVTYDESFGVDYASQSGSGKSATAEEVIAAKTDKVMYASNFTDGYDFKGKLKRSGTASVVDLNGNNVIAYTGTGTIYTYVQPFGGTDAKFAAQNYATHRGQSYTITLDFMFSEDFTFPASINLFNIYCHLKASDGATALSSYKYVPVKIVNGSLTAGLVNTDKVVPLEKGQWYTVSFQHIPEVNKYYLWLNGELIVNGATALKEDSIKPWSSNSITYGGVTYSMEVTGVCDFMPTFFRLPELNPNSATFYMDNVKSYFGAEVYECGHKYTDSAVCDWCGQKGEFDESNHCDICDGQILSENVAVVGRSATLGELIDMNVYVKLANENKPTATLTCVNKSASFNLAALTPEADGTYKLSLPLNSIYMAKDVTLEIDSGTYTTSIKEYAEELLRISTNDSEKALVKALLNYGAAAQEYFAVKNEDETLDDVLANAGLSDADKAVKEYTAAELSDYEFKASGTTASVHFNSVSFVLSAKTYMKIYFSASEDATVEVDGVTYSKVQDGDEYYVILTIPAPAKASDGFTIKITDGSIEASAKIAVHTALEAALYDTTTDAGLVKVLNSYVNYCDFAGKYVK